MFWKCLTYTLFFALFIFNEQNRSFQVFEVLYTPEIVLVYVKLLKGNCFFSDWLKSCKYHRFLKKVQPCFMFLLHNRLIVRNASPKQYYTDNGHLPTATQTPHSAPLRQSRPVLWDLRTSSPTCNCHCKL